MSDNHPRTTVSRRFFMPLLVVLVLSSGCFDYREEIFFNKDMSGTIIVELSVPERMLELYERAGRSTGMFTEDVIRDRLGTIPGLRIINLESYSADERRVVKATVSFDSFDSFRRIPEASPDFGYFGEITLSRTGDGHMSFTRTISLNDKRIAPLAMYDEKLNRRFWVSKVHFPTYVIEANTSKENIDEDTHDTVIWGYSAEVLTKEPRTMKAVFTGASSFDIVPFLLAALVFLAVVVGLYRVLYRAGEVPGDG